MLVLSLCPKHFLQICALCQNCNFQSNRRTFFKKALVFFCEKCYLVSNRSGSWIQSAATHFFTAPVFILLNHAIFFIYLLIIYPVLSGQKIAPPTCTGERFFCYAKPLRRYAPASKTPPAPLRRSTAFPGRRRGRSRQGRRRGPHRLQWWGQARRCRPGHGCARPAFRRA